MSVAAPSGKSSSAASKPSVTTPSCSSCSAANPSEHSHSEEGGHGGYSAMSVSLAIVAILAALVIYGYLYSQNLPQKWTAAAVASHDAHSEDESPVHEETGHESHEGHDGHDHDGHSHETTESTVPVVPATPSEGDGSHSETGHSHEATDTHTHAATHEEAGHGESEIECPPLWMVIPFAILLLCVALLPLIHATEHWWESNLHRFYVAGALGLLTLLYYGFMAHFPIEGHWPAHYVVADDAGPVAKMTVVFINAIVSEYIPFIILLFSLFTISGGIRIEGDMRATPLNNSIILLIGTLLASFVGTTGAAMLLIRLLLETNKERKYKAHTVVFFIFCVCNCGGCLLPIGDPPLFLGYLMGVKFLWTLHLWVEWAFVNAILITLYFLFDSLYFYRREPVQCIRKDNTEIKPLQIKGLALNLPLLIGVILGVALLAPEKTLGDWNPPEFVKSTLIAVTQFEGIMEWHPPYFLREAVQLTMCLLSLTLGCRLIKKANAFNFNAIIEVAALFFGIFICMQAPLQILKAEGDKLPVDTPTKFYWATGALSAVLDNAPTYVVFFEAGKAKYQEELKEGVDGSGDPLTPEIAAEHKRITGVLIDPQLLAAISLGAVFMGAMTYIGNGPNFMVKAIAEQSGVKMPSFFGYMVYSVLILIPIFILMDVIFLW